MLRIDRLLKEKDMSTQQLAAMMHVTPQYVSEVANGRKNITLSSLAKFAEALDVPLAALIDGYHDKELMGVSSFNCPHCGKVITVEKEE